MATIDGTLYLCICCTLLVVNADESGCRDFHGHDHPSCGLPVGTTVMDEGQEKVNTWMCDGCDEWQEAFSQAFRASI